jgi:hypothetical protein
MRSRSRCRELAAFAPKRKQLWTVPSAVPPVLLLVGRRRQTRQDRSRRSRPRGTDASARCGALGGRHSLTADPDPREWRWAMFVNRATLRIFNHRLGGSVVRGLRTGAPGDLLPSGPATTTNAHPRRYSGEPAGRHCSAAGERRREARSNAFGIRTSRRRVPARRRDYVNWMNRSGDRTGIAAFRQRSTWPENYTVPSIHRSALTVHVGPF